MTINNYDKIHYIYKGSQEIEIFYKQSNFSGNYFLVH